MNSNSTDTTDHTPNPEPQVRPNEKDRTPTKPPLPTDDAENLHPFNHLSPIRTPLADVFVAKILD